MTAKPKVKATDKTTLQLRLSVRMKERMERMAAEDGVTVSSYVRRSANRDYKRRYKENAS